MSSVGTSEGLQATAIYIDLVQGLKGRVASLERMNTLLAGLAIVALIGLVLLLPLKKRVPYFYEVDSGTGRVALSNRVVDELKVSDKNTAYFLRAWTARLVTINAATLKDGLPSAFRWTRGAAQTELDQWVDKVDRTAERIGKTPGLTRELIGVPTVSFNEDRNVAFVDFVWVEKVNGQETERKRKLLTLEFGLVPPKEGREEADPDNPLGLAITHFTINEQVSR
jgi:type IV secretory pathway component VirB8